MGDEVIEINKGDHIAFLAGEELAHHLVNTSSATLMYLVFGERKETDVVFYPDSSIVLSKTSKGHRWYSFEAYEQDV